MNNTLKEVLKKIVDNGFEAYVIGGYVRDLLLNKYSEDYDICTSAKKEDLENIFNRKFNDNFGSIILDYKGSIFEITTYRKELSYEGVRSPNIVYTDSLEEDLLRRDFTINTICMDYQGNYLDLLGGIDDIKNKIIKCVGNADKKMKEDPLRILRAIRFASILDFTIDDNLDKAIRKYAYNIKKLSFFRKKQELDLIFESGNIGLLKEYQLEEYLSIDINNVISVKSNLGIWAQIIYSDEYQFSNNEKFDISIIQNIILKKEITNYDLYLYDLEVLKVAGNIIGVNNLDIRYLNLPIKSRQELSITYKGIKKNTDILPSEIYRILEHEILDNNLKNEYLRLIEYIRNMKDNDIDK